MKDALRGLDNLTRRFPAAGKSMAALTGLLVFCSTTGYGQVILDDFSADHRSNYDFVKLFADPSDGWAVTSGTLRPSIEGNASATWLWNQGEKLSAVGDSVSISISLPGGADASLPTSIGLFLLGDTEGYEITTYTTLGGAWYYNVAGDARQAASALSGPVQLTIQRTDQTEYTCTFSGSGLPGITFFDASDSLRFGPFAANTIGTPAALDNFTFTAVPEPSMYAAVFGFLALATAVIRNRTSRRC
jgi:hypothetical protein